MMPNFFKDKVPGFYFSCCAAVLGTITAIVYAVSYANFSLQGGSIMNWNLVIVFLLMIVEFAALVLLKQYKLLPWVLAATALAALCLYIYSMYYYVSVMVYGIDATFTPTFFGNCILVVAVYAVSVIALFLPQIKENAADGI